MTNTFRRIEKKTSLTMEEAEEIRKRILPFMHEDPHNQDGKWYMICNLYFDGEDDHVIRTSSVEHPKYKEKLRLRSYGIPTDDSIVFLELKKKYYGVGTKRRVKLPLRDADEYLRSGTHPPGLPYLDEQILREIDYYRSHETVEPRVYVSYLRRAYYGKEDPNFRVTFDSDILTRRYDLDLRLGRYGDEVLTKGKLILEVKFPGAVPLWFTRIMSEYHLSFHTFSKVGTDFKLDAYRRACEEHPDEDIRLRLIH